MSEKVVPLREDQKVNNDLVRNDEAGSFADDQSSAQRPSLGHRYWRLIQSGQLALGSAVLYAGGQILPSLNFMPGDRAEVLSWVLCIAGVIVFLMIAVCSRVFMAAIAISSAASLFILSSLEFGLGDYWFDQAGWLLSAAIVGVVLGIIQPPRES